MGEASTVNKVTGTLNGGPSPGTALVETPEPAPATAAEPTAALPENPSPASAHPGEPAALDLDTVRKFWPDLIKKVGTTLGWKLAQVEPIEVEQPDLLVIAVKPGYNATFDECGTPEAQAKIAQALERLVRRPVNIKYVRRSRDHAGQEESRQNEAERADALGRDPLVQRLLELFEAPPGPGGLRRKRPIFRKLTEPAGTGGPRPYRFLGLLERFKHGSWSKSRAHPAGKKPCSINWE